MPAEQEEHGGFESMRNRIARERSAARTDVEAGMLTDLRVGGVPGLLRTLNQRTRFRFTGLYRLDASTCHSAALFDRENSALTFRSTPHGDTFSGVPGRGDSLAIVFGAVGCRIASLFAPATTVSCISALIRDARGHTLGALCHLDYRPRLLSPSEVLLLERVASCLTFSGEDGTLVERRTGSRIQARSSG